ncbi:MAG: carbohydrate ABC transporter permease [candidate division Zixibacteria bacterium]|nr:carbohydrate ABC transporter permease [candidate division Zixibacteria bacterium]
MIRVNSKFKFGISVIIIALYLLPLYWLAISSFRPVEELFSKTYSFLPQKITLINYKGLFDDLQFLTYIKNSLIVSVSSVIITLLLAIPGSYYLARYDIKWQKLLIKLALFTYMMPSIIFVIPYFELMNTLNLDNKLVALVLTYLSFTLPFSFWFLWNYFSSFPFVLEEAAMIDGASRFNAFFSVTLPLSIPGMIAIGLFTFILSWNEFLFASVFLSENSNFTIPVGVSTYLEATAINWPRLMAASMVILLPAFLVYVFFHKYLLKGFGAHTITVNGE